MNAGTGSVMRCEPHAIAFADDTPEAPVEVSRQSSAITHYDLRCTHGCAVEVVVPEVHLPKFLFVEVDGVGEIIFWIAR